MPAIITHYTFALENEKELEPRLFKALALGAQGPDPYFFFGQRPWKRRNGRREVNAFGVELHHTDITDSYAALLEKARSSDDPELLYSYVQGLFLHYSLDRNCHPYIWSRCGFGRDFEEKKLWGASHTWLETLLDFIIGSDQGTFTRKAGKRYLDSQYQDLLRISSLWSEMNGELIKNPMIKEHTFLLAVKDYEAIMRLTNVPHGFSKLLTRLMGKNSVAHRMNYPKKMPDSLESVDFLNEERGCWVHPVSGKDKHDSFKDLWDKAKRDYERAKLIILKAKNGEPYKEELRLFVNGIDHDGFRPSDEKRYMSPIWPGYDEY